MDYLEANPLPQACANCLEEECYNCDHALERWCLSAKDQLTLKEKMKLRGIRRFERELAEIDKVLLEKEKGGKHLAHRLIILLV